MMTTTMGWNRSLGPSLVVCLLVLVAGCQTARSPSRESLRYHGVIRQVDELHGGWRVEIVDNREKKKPIPSFGDGGFNADLDTFEEDILVVLSGMGIEVDDGASRTLVVEVEQYGADFKFGGTWIGCTELRLRGDITSSEPLSAEQCSTGFNWNGWNSANSQIAESYRAAVDELVTAVEDANIGVKQSGAPTAEPPKSLRDRKHNSDMVAVLEIRAHAKLDRGLSLLMSDAVRAAALASLGKRGATVMTRENMLVLLEDMGGCGAVEGECEVETGRNLGADVIVSGEYIEVGRTSFVSLKAFDVESGNLLATRRAESTGGVDLLKATESAAIELFVDVNEAH